jgi:hypothetical protein
MSIEAHARMQAGDDEELPRQVSDIQSLAAGQRVGLMDREQDIFAADGLDDDTWRPLQHGRADKPDIQLVLIEQLQLLLGSNLIQADVDLWALLPKGMDCCGDNAGEDRRPDKANLQNARLAATGLYRDRVGMSKAGRRA